MKKIIFTDEEIRKIELLYSQGMGCAKIGEIFKLSKRPILELLRKRNLLNKGTSDGRKIVLTENQEKKIYELYHNENKNPTQIAKNLQLSLPFIDKFLQTSGYRRNKAEAMRVLKTGVKLPKKTVQNMIKAQKKISDSGKRKQTGGICKVFEIEGIFCHGTFEKFFLEKLLKENKPLPKNCEPVKTPYGMYYPDFQVNNHYVEIKSDYTYEILLGKEKNRWSKKFDFIQLKKIEWVNENIRKVDIIVVDKKNNKLTKKTI